MKYLIIFILSISYIQSNNLNTILENGLQSVYGNWKITDLFCYRVCGEINEGYLDKIIEIKKNIPPKILNLNTTEDDIFNTNKYYYVDISSYSYEIRDIRDTKDYYKKNMYAKIVDEGMAEVDYFAVYRINGFENRSGNTITTHEFVILSQDKLVLNSSYILERVKTLSDNGINRDTDNTTVTGNEVTTGALEVDITVDVASIVNAKENITNLPGNLITVGVGAITDIYAVGMKTYATLDKEGAKKLVLNKIDKDNVNSADAYKQVMKEGGLSNDYIDGREQHIDTIADKLSGSGTFWKTYGAVGILYNDKNIQNFATYTSSVAASVMRINNGFTISFFNQGKDTKGDLLYGGYNQYDNTLNINTSKDIDKFNKENNIKSNKELLDTIVHETSHAFQFGVTNGNIKFGTANDRKKLNEAKNNYDNDTNNSKDDMAYYNNLLEADSRYVGMSTANNVDKRLKPKQ